VRWSIGVAVIVAICTSACGSQLSSCTLGRPAKPAALLEPAYFGLVKSAPIDWTANNVPSGKNGFVRIGSRRFKVNAKTRRLSGYCGQGSACFAFVGVDASGAASWMVLAERNRNTGAVESSPSVICQAPRSLGPGGEVGQADWPHVAAVGPRTQSRCWQHSRGRPHHGQGDRGRSSRVRVDIHYFRARPFGADVHPDRMCADTES
jgi:hypothetical protein